MRQWGRRSWSYFTRVVSEGFLEKVSFELRLEDEKDLAMGG
jgi:hypothetical protein